ncbi:recombinase family protein [Siminovitchia acidinfaciens]|uniref:hypothetical protein n=1 Tax=Siminovitchia acidinfaciens TaxID=2321395 RepID=UPI001F17CC8C|nr:hypothetical protein [Siminovitchia acidinfaciens]
MLLRNDEVSDVQISWQESLYMVYVKVSTDNDEQFSSPENQIEICQYWLEKTTLNGKLVVFENGISESVFT